MLAKNQVNEYVQNGCVVIKSFYDTKKEIEPIQYGIYRIIGALIKREGLRINQAPFSPETFDSGFMDLIAYDRSLGGIVYDAAKQIPAFVRLVSKEKNETLFKQLYATSQPGIGHGGQGVRIDAPNEEKFLSPWHQEYCAQMRSLKGMVYWSPLVKMTNQLGPVEVCLKSHREGVFPLYAKNPTDPNKYGAYGMLLVNEQEITARYAQALPLTEPGDLILLDWLILHRSTPNTSTRPRWALQQRYFDFEDPTGIKFGWPGGVTVGNDVRNFHPELAVL